MKIGIWSPCAAALAPCPHHSFSMASPPRWMPTPCRCCGPCGKSPACPAPNSAAAWRCAVHAPCTWTARPFAPASCRCRTVAGRRSPPSRAAKQARQGRAGGLDRAAGAPVRLLPIGPDHVGDGAAGEKSRADRRRHRQRDERQHLPLRDYSRIRAAIHAAAQSHQGLSHDPDPLRCSRRRREFLKTAGSVGDGAHHRFRMGGPRDAPRVAAPPAPAPALFAPNAFLRIGADGSVTVIAKHSKWARAPIPASPPSSAEELDADWARVRVESAPADAKRYANFAFGMQGTGGSSAMANSWMQLREAGAKARAMLLSRGGQGVACAGAELTSTKASSTTPPASARRASARCRRGPRRCRCPTR
jgi:hypothetical protein